MVTLLAQTPQQMLVDTLSNLLFWGTLIAAIVIITLGYFFQRKTILTENWEKILVRIVILVGLPSLIFKSFMVDLDLESFKNMAFLMGIGLLFYGSMSYGSKFLFFKTGKSFKDSLSMTVVFASNIYFGLPIINALYPNNASEINAAANMFNVGYWLFMCTYAVYIMKRKVPGFALDGTRLKVKEKNLDEKNKENRLTKKEWKELIINPIILATLIGFILWIMQLIPGIDVIKVTDSGWNTIKPGYYSVTRIDALIPGAAAILSTLSALTTPLAWFAMGAVIAKGSLKNAIKVKAVWYAFFLKNFLTPSIGLLLVMGFAAIGHAANDAFIISSISLQLIVIMLAAPTSSTIVGYSIAYNKEPVLTSQVATLTTFGAIVTIPLWTLIAAVVSTMTIFTV